MIGDCREGCENVGMVALVGAGWPEVPGVQSRAGHDRC